MHPLQQGNGQKHIQDKREETRKKKACPQGDLEGTEK
jgi:hypothetical protein